MKIPSSHVVQMIFDSPLGQLHVAAKTPEVLLGVWFADQRHAPIQLQGEHAWPVAQTEDAAYALLGEARQQIIQYLNGQRRLFELPLGLEKQGTLFQQSVWRGLCAIPYGHTASYGQLSQRIGRAAAVRATGGAVGRNPWTLLVPCHRIIGSNGALTGYAGGLARKHALLELENAQATRGV